MPLKFSFMGTPKLDMLNHKARLEGKVRRHASHYLTSLKKEKPWYYIRIRYFSGLEVTPPEYRSQAYWDTFNLTRNLFFTKLQIKHIEMIQIKPHTSTEKNILQHDR